MFEEATDDIKTEVLDHHGLVAAICEELQLKAKIDDRIGSKDPRRVVQPGTAIVAMIINGLGFTNRRLYLTPQFFQSKPIQMLLGEDVQAQDLNDHALGKALDEVADYGSSRLFAEMAFTIAKEQHLLEDMIESRLDSTSFSLHGKYDTEEDAEVIEICKGYSKDHRPDLNQVLLSLVMGTPANLPMWMESNSGNKSDKVSFHETVRRMRAFQKQLKLNDSHWIADSAFYTTDKLLSHKNLKWTTRVPETIGVCKRLLEEDDFQWTELDSGYSFTEVGTWYGNIKQRWIIVKSEQAFQREAKTLDKKIKKELENALKACWHLGNERFSCKKDAEAALVKLNKQYRFHRVEGHIEELLKYSTKGRPKLSDKPTISGVKIVCHPTADKSRIDQEKRCKGRFVIATNDLDDKQLPATRIVNSYRGQQNVERGFCFLKDPWFMVNSFFLKKRKRIEALMMIMTLCLFVYNLAQYRIRKALKKHHQTIPNQKGKEFQKPTLKWIFQIMEGIGVTHFFDEIKSRWRSLVTNIDATRRIIIVLFGEAACKIYGLKKNFAGK